ncbi:MAG: extracellular solute-binding protein [Aggregatilineales bacterium]
MLKRLGLLIVLMLSALAISPIIAQDDDIALTIRASAFTEDLFRDLLDQFEAEHPGVRVVIEPYNGINAPTPTFNDIESYLDDFAEYATSADILPVNNDLNNYATRAGYLLDLAPIISSDADINSADFRQSLWDSFRWDGGMWALPVSGGISTLFYDPQAFDEAGLTYPDASWTITDLTNAIRALTTYDADGDIDTPGFINTGFNDNALTTLLISLLGNGLNDTTTIPSTPDFSDPRIAEILDVWAALQADGLLNPQVGDLSEVNIPLALGGAFLATGFSNDGTTREPALLPGGHVGMAVTGYAISSGTQHPEIAYELIKFLSNNRNAVNTFFASTPARYALDSTEDSEISSGGVTFSFAGAGDNPELEAFTLTAIEDALPLSQMLFTEAIEEAFSAMTENGLDALSALQQAENTVLANLALADERGNTPIFVDSPAPEAVLAAGEIALNVAVTGFISPFPNEEQWQTMAETFSANDPEVGILNLETTFPGGLDSLSEQYDCFYTPSNLIPGADLSLLRNLDPLLSADANFDPNDLISGALEQVRVNNQIWGLPITIEPQVLRYNPDLFTQAGVIAPENGWTVAEFEEALRLLERNLDLENAPFAAPILGGDSYLLNLIAAYGGLPIDNRTSPPTFNFTDPATVNAIREVLDLAREELIEYSQLVTAGGNEFSISLGDENTDAVYGETLNGFGFGGGGGIFLINTDGDDDSPQLPENPDRLTTYPTGSQFNAVTYNMGVGYISANSPNTEACYRFLKQISQSPELFSAMPARRSQIDNPELESAQNPELIAFYQRIADILAQPNTIILPGASGGSFSTITLNHWLDRVFDGYVADEITDLESALAEAETFTRAYQDCVADIPAFNPAEVDDPQAYFQQFTDCALQVDPSSAEFLGS